MKLWKNWPYWLKGGVIGGGITLLSAGLTDACEMFFVAPNTSLGLECFIFAIPWIPFWFFPELRFFSVISYEIIVFVAWSVLGALLGFLISHLKPRK